MKFSLLILFIILSLCSCNQAHDRCSLQKSKEYILPINDVVIQTPMHWYDSADGAHLWVRASKNKLIHYAISKSMVIDSSNPTNEPLPNKFDFDFAVDGFYLFKSNIESSTCNFFPKNHQPKILLKYNTDNTEIYLFNFPLTLREGRTAYFYCPSKLRLPKENDRYFASKTISETQFADTDMRNTRKLCDYPEAYRKKMYNETVPCATLTPSGLAYVYSTEPTIFLDSAKHFVSHRISGLDKNKFFPVNPDSVIYSAYNNMIKTEEEQYEQLLYDPVSRSYLLFQTRAIKANNNMLETPAFEDKPFTVYIIDSNYAVAGRMDFSKLDGYMRLTKAHFYNGILYLPKSDLKSHSLKIETYAITKVSH